MKKKAKKIFCMIIVAIIMLSLMPPLPARSVAGVDAVAKGLQAIGDFLNITGGIALIPSTCICVIDCNPISRAWCRTRDPFTEHFEDRERAMEEIINRHAPTAHVINQQADAHIQAWQRVIDEVGTRWEGVDLVEQAEAIIRRIDPPPPPPNHPTWPIWAGLGGGFYLHFMLYRTTESDMEDWMDFTRPIWEQRLEQQNEGLFFCFITREMVPRRPIQPPNPLFLGYCTVCGVPIFPYPMPTVLEVGTLLQQAVEQHATQTYIDRYGRTVSATVTRIGDGLK
jgi:hypothetical protein